MCLMIKTFRSKAFEMFAATGDGSKLPVKNHAKVRRIIDALNAATQPEDMNVPGYHFHSLQGDPKRYSVRVTGNYRITWGWEEGDAVAVDIEDYH